MRNIVRGLQQSILQARVGTLDFTLNKRRSHWKDSNGRSPLSDLESERISKCGGQSRLVGVVAEGGGLDWEAGAEGVTRDQTVDLFPTCSRQHSLEGFDIWISVSSAGSESPNGKSFERMNFKLDKRGSLGI